MKRSAIDLEAVQIVFQLCELQRRLVEQFLEDYHPRDLVWLSDVPRKGSLQLGSQAWQYSRHGAGVTFRSPDAVVNAHEGLATYPDAVDEWRLLLYLEATGAKVITFDGDAAAAHDQTELERLLEKMTRAGFLEEVHLQSGRRLFRPSRGD